MIALLLAASALAPKPDWTPTFVQDFDGPAGSPPDPKVWTRDLGGSGFGNAELQCYTDGAANAFLDGKGHLVIEARKERTVAADGKVCDYSSARMHTQGSFRQKYGRFEARLKLPQGKGIWPAFWMLGTRTAELGWPAGGELDIMEFIGHEVRTVHGTLHGPGYSGSNSWGGSYEAPTPLPDAFHTFGVEWDPNGIRWFIDDHVYRTTTPDDLKSRQWVFDDPFFLIINLAVGGYWPGYPDATTVFPQRLVVDWIRAFRDKNLKVDPAAIAAAHRARMLKYQEYKGPRTFDVPGTIDLVDYRAEGTRDLDDANQGGEYRPVEAVDIGGSGVEAPKFSVGWTLAGEVLAYDLDVKRAGDYRLVLHVASAGQGGSLRCELKGKTIGQEATVPDTGGWQAWKPLSLGTAKLSAGKQVLRLAMLSNGSTGSVGNLLKLEILPVP